MSGSDVPAVSCIGDKQRLGRYRIISILGEGGMGKVYRAFDPQLGRDVALKILNQGSTSASRLRRLRREGRAAAALNHPNIVSIFDIGESDGVEYIVTEVVEGETLASILRAGALSPPVAIDFAVPIARALAAAHAAGVVHRDLKPSNILVTRSGFPKIADFGLAKFIEPAAGNASQMNTFDIGDRTAEGVIVGTAAYMSPEQARGESADFRSDQFSFAAMLYEMLVGRRAFQRGSGPETLAAVIADDPMLSESTFIPEDLRRILARCLQKDPRLRYGATDDLVHDLEECRSHLASQRRSILSVRRILAATFALAAVVAGASGWFLITHRHSPSAVPEPRGLSLAVLPFRNAGADVSLQHFGLGLADAITSELAALQGVTVRPTSTVARFEGRGVDAIRAGRDLGVSTVLEGSFERSNAGFHVTAQLTDVERSAIVWSTRFQVREGELFKFEDVASRAIADALRLRVSPVQRGNWMHQSKVSDAAMADYLSLHPLLVEVPRQSREFRKHVLSTLNAILEREPDFARAIGARAYVESCINFYEPAGEWQARAQADANRALALDPSLFEARIARAQLLDSSSGGWQVFEALNEYRDAERVAPGSELVHINLARLYRHLGWVDKFDGELRIIHAIDPAANEAKRLRALLLGDLGKCSEALAEFDRVTPSAGDAVPVWQAVAATRLHCGEVHPIRDELETQYRLSNRDSLEHPMTTALLALARLRDGVRDVSALEQEALSVDQRAGHFHHTTLVLAEIRAIEGDVNHALRFLRQTAEMGMPTILGFEHNSFLNGIRTSADYRALIAELRRREPTH